jgi:CO/xanthine dehydrogenase Mo-binding subunit
LRIDASRARAMPGVFAVLTHIDVPDVKYGGMVEDRRLFAKDKVRWEGDIIAGVAALTPEIAQDAADLVEVEYEVLPAIADFEAAMGKGAPLVHEDWETNTADEVLVRGLNTLGYFTIVKGDADAAMADADVVVKSRYVADASQGVPIEPRAILAEWQGDRVTVWSSTQVPFAARSGIAHTLLVPESHVRVVVPLLGGGFGSKCGFHFEAHVAALASAARRPVKLVFSRREEFIAPDHRREGMIIELETGARRDGTLVARRGRLVLDKGAYSGEGGFMGQLAAMHACGPYKIENVRVESYVNYTNGQPSGSIRAPTAPQVCWALEQHMDELAAALGMEGLELRRLTLIERGSEGPTRQVFEEIGMKETLEKAAELIGYGADLPDDEAIGFACGWWPSFGSNSGAYVKLNPDGSGTIVTGAQENGSGAVMGLPLLAADLLGMKPEDFSILFQDTEAGPWDNGSSASQTTFNNGRAVIEAAAEVREKLLELAAEKLEVSPCDLALTGGAVHVKGARSKTVSIAELAATGTPILGKGSGQVPENPACEAEGCVGRLGFESFLAPQVFTHAARIRLDRETGVVRVLQVAAAHDCGTILNPVGASGQVYGGVVMGVGLALLESSQLDAACRQLNPHLLDYKLVTAADAPKIDIAWVETPTADAGPNGSKGVGEPPCVPTAGAIANAISKLIGGPVRQLPMTPERVWAASQEPVQ